MYVIESGVFRLDNVLVYNIYYIFLYYYFDIKSLRYKLEEVLKIIIFIIIIIIINIIICPIIFLFRIYDVLIIMFAENYKKAHIVDIYRGVASTRIAQEEELSVICFCDSLSNRFKVSIRAII